MKEPLVSVIIVTYNSVNYLKSCLNSILSTEYKNLEIIIVDNKSNDDTTSIIKSFKDKVNPFFIDKNLGYAGGNNLGVSKAKGEYIFFLNPDTLVTEDIFKFLVESLDSNSQLAVAQPAVYLMNDHKILNLTGKITNFLGFDWVRDYHKKLLPDQGEIMSFSGCGVMIKKSAFLQAKGFDKNYFMYYEDSDLSWKLRLLGYKLLFVPQAIMYHDYKYIPVESYQPLKKKLFFNERNRLVTIYKNYSTKTLLLLLPAIVILEVCMLTFSLLNGWFLEKVKGYMSIINMSNDLNNNRLFIQENRKLTDKQITSDYVSELNLDIYNSSIVRLFINPFLFFYWTFVKRLI